MYLFSAFALLCWLGFFIYLLIRFSPSFHCFHFLTCILVLFPLLTLSVAGALLQIVLGNLAQEMFCLQREGDLGPMLNLVFPPSWSSRRYFISRHKDVKMFPQLRKLYCSESCHFFHCLLQLPGNAELICGSAEKFRHICVLKFSHWLFSFAFYLPFLWS